MIGRASAESSRSESNWTGGCWARVVDKAKVVEIFGHVRGERRMAEFLRTLEDNKRYAAVARET